MVDSAFAVGPGRVRQPDGDDGHVRIVDFIGERSAVRNPEKLSHMHHETALGRLIPA